MVFYCKNQITNIENLPKDIQQFFVFDQHSTESRLLPVDLPKCIFRDIP